MPIKINHCRYCGQAPMIRAERDNVDVVIYCDQWSLDLSPTQIKPFCKANEVRRQWCAPIEEWNELNPVDLEREQLLREQVLEMR